MVLKPWTKIATPREDLRESKPVRDFCARRMEETARSAGMVARTKSGRF
jgi:hypothetical protein